MRAKYPGPCRQCGGRVTVGDEIFWSRETRALHPECEEELHRREWTDVERVMFGVIPVEEASAETLALLAQRDAEADARYEECMADPGIVECLEQLRSWSKR